LNAIAGIERIHADLPGVRLIVSLRQPADRAYSSYLSHLMAGRESRSADDALQSGSYPFETSFYYPRLRRYYDRFPAGQIKVILFDDLIASSQEILRELFRFLGVDEDFIADTTVRHNPGVVPRSMILNRLFDSTFRLVRPLVPEWLLSRGLGTKLRGPMVRKAEPMAPQLRRRLTEQYRDDVVATGELIGRDLSHWLA
jgi:hypothetical protein